MTNMPPACVRTSCIALAMCLSLVACAGVGGGRTDASPDGPGWAHTPAGIPLTPQAAMERIALGQSGKADVAAGLGTAIVIEFDSGYAIWVYRWAGAGNPTPRAATELVLLFDPTGLVTKLRLRPGYPEMPTDARPPG
jgi:hypothetical protein